MLGIDSHWSLILAYSRRHHAAHLDHQGLFRLHRSGIDKAAQIDGATPWQTFRYVLPAAVGADPRGGVRAELHRHRSTNTRSPRCCCASRQHDARGRLALYLYEQRYLWGDFAAAAILSGLPITIVFLLAQKWMISGLTAGGIKG